MKGDCGRCLEMRLAEIPGHDVNWTRVMVAIKVDLTGLKDDTWKYFMGLRLVVS